MGKFRVDLDAYNGPLDLLLFLIRQEEVDVYDIPIARITEQYLDYLKVLEACDPNLAGDFLVMAATLMEIKSRTLLPQAPADEVEDEFVDPRMELVRQLLEYKRFKDAAHSLGAAAQMQGLRFGRQPVRLDAEPDERDLEEVEIWHLIEAFNRLLEQTGRQAATHDVAYDDTPIALHAADVVDALERAGGSQHFEDIFAGRNKGELIGLFLALLELIRQRRIRAEQDQPFGPIIIHLLEPAEDEEAAPDPAESADVPEQPQPVATEPELPEPGERAPPATPDTLTEARHDPQ